MERLNWINYIKTHLEKSTHNKSSENSGKEAAMSATKMLSKAPVIKQSGTGTRTDRQIKETE